MHGIETVESILQVVCEYSVCLFDVICIGIMLWGGVHSLCMLFRKSPAKVVIQFSGYMNMALLFKLGAEIIRMSIVRTFAELGLVAGIVLLHFAISYIIHWENVHRHHQPSGDAVMQEASEAASGR